MLEQVDAQLVLGAYASSVVDNVIGIVVRKDGSH
jgi:hypothetical protein